MERALEPQFLLYCQHHKSCIRNIFQFMGYSEMERPLKPQFLSNWKHQLRAQTSWRLRIYNSRRRLRNWRYHAAILIIDNYSQKCRWIAVNMYLVAKWRGHLDHFQRLRSNTYHTETKRLVQL